MKNKKTEIKDWTEPKYLNIADWTRLKRIKHFYEKGEMGLAMEEAYNSDTAIREEIPPHIWVAMGGTLTKAGEEKLRLYLESEKNLKE